VSESIIKCIPDESMKTGECIIHNEKLKEMVAIYYLFNGTHNGIPVNNTIEGKYPTQCGKDAQLWHIIHGFHLMSHSYRNTHLEGKTRLSSITFL